MDVAIADDASAFLALDQGDNANSAYTSTSGGELVVEFTGDSDAMGDGVASDSLMTFEDVFKVRNQGTQRVEVGLDEVDDGGLSYNFGKSGKAGGNGFEDFLLKEGKDDIDDRIGVAFGTKVRPYQDGGGPPEGDNDPDRDDIIELGSGEEVFVEFAIYTDGDESFPDVNTLLITASADPA
ncbi:hypothetical protein BRC71_11645 [Halobacteriales archaeon QH_7_65_31]|nr:MAG: hypothetical protein BRC71_11645 [Halobacteriales archaeon QH_7_65_31]